MNHGKIKHIKATCEFDKSIGNIYLNGHGIDRYIEKETGQVVLVHVTSGGKWVGFVKPEMSLYEKMYDAAQDGTELLIALGNRFFGMRWGK